jgi:N-acetylglucosaminyl-diphospho-decaprenol L-rhamnosyltransferase
MTSTMTPPDLSIVIVSWNVRDLLIACLESILRSVQDSHSIRAELIVVDSASTDGSAVLIAERFPAIRVLPQSENLGFTAGNNLGLQSATGRYLMLLNPDTIVVDDALAKMVAYLDANPKVGALGPQTLNPDGSTQSTRRRFPTIAIGFWESTWIQPFAPRHLLDCYYATDIQDNQIAEVDWVQGSALVVRREVYAQIGGLDTGYVMYSEELDWCRRIKSAGWQVIYLGTVQIIHYGGQSTDQVTTRSHIHFQQSKLRYFRKYHGPIVAFVLRIFLIGSYMQQYLTETLKGALGHKRDLRQARTRVYRQVIRVLVRQGTSTSK